MTGREGSLVVSRGHFGAVPTGPVCGERQWGRRGLPGLQGTSVIMLAFPASEAIPVQTV